MDSQSIWEKRLPQSPEALWHDTVELPSFSALKEDKEVDVTIVGGGISGITTAYLLSKEGVRVAIVEAGRLCNGITGHTTAKVTAQHGLIYDEFINHFGEEKAKLYYKANQDAINFLKETSLKLGIDCNLEDQNAYVYTNSDQKLSKLEKEAEAYQRLHIPGELVNQLPLDMSIKSGIVMHQQAHYHPLKFMKRLVEEIVKAGGAIYENTPAKDVEEGASPVVITRDGHRIRSGSIVLASHYPFYDKKGFYFARMYQERSYLLAARTKKKYPGGMYINAETPSRSLRDITINGEQLVIIAGESHKTGHDTNTMKHYTDLAAFGDNLFEIEKIVNHWSAQDITTLDKLPYIGALTSNIPNIFVATGYRKWGMSNGLAAGLLLSDLVLKRDNPYEELYSPSRFHADPDIKSFISQNVDVAGHFLAGKVETTDKTIDDIKENEAGIVKVNGKRTGCYKDEEGTTYLVDTTCTHMYCEVEWNNSERSWDCPCHGSRFSYTGEVMEGPATKPLTRVDKN